MTEDQNDNTRTHVVLTKGTVISQYRIIGRIGAGGMGEVYLAEDPELDRKVALKFIPHKFVDNHDVKARFKREAQAAAKLSHPNIVHIYEVGELNGRPYFAMEYVDGLELTEYCANKTLETNKIVDLAIQICDGLSKAHKASITHRDIKSSNILIDADGRPKILDFGLATFVGSEEVTKEGSTIGTVAYMSPEQAQGQAVDHRSDLFSLGIVIYELIAGITPFKRNSDAATMNAIINEVPEPLARYRSEVPVELQRIMTKLLQKDSSLRYQSADGLISDLKTLSISGQSATMPAEKTKANRIWQITSIVFSIAAIILLILWLKSDNSATSSGNNTKYMLAVLPFENLGSSDDEYFADGITDEITARLSVIGKLGIIARTSVMQYKGTEKTIAQIGEELGVDYILEGTVRWQKSTDSPDRVRVTPQLIKVSDETHSWAEVYDEEISGVFKVQTDISNQIVKALDIVLLEPEKKLIENQPTDNMEAFDLYLRGKAYMTINYYAKLPNLRSAELLFNKAIKLDPRFASALAKLSQTYTEMYFHHIKIDSILEKSKTLIDSAMRIDSSLPDVNMALASYHYHLNDYDRALERLELALTMQPNNTDLLVEMGHIRRRLGQGDLALESYKKVAELDPLSGAIRAQIGITYQWLKNYQEAARYFKLCMSLTPDDPEANRYYAMNHILERGNIAAALKVIKAGENLGVFWDNELTGAVRVYLAAGDYDEARKILFVAGGDISGRLYANAMIGWLEGDSASARLYGDSARVLLEETNAEAGENAVSLLGLSTANAVLGNAEKTVEYGERGLELSPVSKQAMEHPKYRYWMAINYTMVGEYERAFEMLEIVLSVPCFHSVHSIQVDPFFKLLRDQPRFKALIEKYDKPS